MRKNKSLNDFLDAAEDLAIKGLKNDSKPIGTDNMVKKFESLKGKLDIPQGSSLTQKAVNQFSTDTKRFHFR